MRGQKELAERGNTVHVVNYRVVGMQHRVHDSLRGERKIESGGACGGFMQDGWCYHTLSRIIHAAQEGRTCSLEHAARKTTLRSCHILFSVLCDEKTARHKTHGQH